MAHRRRAWTSTDQITAEIAAACGCTLQQIADCLNRSCSTVSRRIYAPYMEKHLQRTRAWRQQNIKESRKICKKWKKNNKDKVKEMAKRRVSMTRLQAKSGNNILTAQELSNAFEHFVNSCAYCGKIHNLTIDHYIPLSKGGQHAISNIVPACLSCNCSKGAKKAEEWYKTRDYFDESRFKQIETFLTQNLGG